MNRKTAALKTIGPVYERICHILESARTSVARSVNTTQVMANWLIGREIVEEEQRGKARADYGKKLMETLSAQMAEDFGPGYSVQNLFYFKQFYLTYSSLIVAGEILHAARGESWCGLPSGKLHALRGRLEAAKTPTGKGSRRSRVDASRQRSETLHGKPTASDEDDGSVPMSYTLCAGSWTPGQLHPNLSWTHYRTLLRVEKQEARAFYEIEAIENNWAARELERQINSLLYERLALSRDKKGLMRLALKGHEVQKPVDVFKDPVVMEFVGLPESPMLHENDLEHALIADLQSFLLELGKGFAFVARQERLTLDGDHFYIDLVFYHTILKCYVIIDLKTGKLTHQDLGQLQLYVNYYDRERRTEGDNPTLGLILCADKNDAVVRYTLGADQQKTIFASRYKLHLPSVAELRAELRREVRAIAAPSEKNQQYAKDTPE